MQDEGYIAATFFSDGAKDIPLGTPLCIVVEELEDIAAFKDYKPEAKAAAAEPTPAAATPAAPTPVAPTPAAPVQAAAPTQAAPVQQSGDRKFVSPLAANLAQDHGVNLAGVAGSGPNGRIIRADIEDALSQPAAPQQVAAPELVSSPGSGFVDLPNS